MYWNGWLQKNGWLGLRPSNFIFAGPSAQPNVAGQMCPSCPGFSNPVYHQTSRSRSLVTIQVSVTAEYYTRYTIFTLQVSFTAKYYMLVTHHKYLFVSFLGGGIFLFSERNRRDIQCLLNAVFFLQAVNYLQHCKSIMRVSGLVIDPPVIYPPLGKIHPFRTYHFTLL